MAAPLPQGGGWFYLTGQGDSVQHHGPFSVDVMKSAPLAAPISSVPPRAAHPFGTLLCVAHGWRVSCCVSPMDGAVRGGQSARSSHKLVLFGCSTLRSGLCDRRRACLGARGAGLGAPQGIARALRCPRVPGCVALAFSRARSARRPFGACSAGREASFGFRLPRTSAHGQRRAVAESTVARLSSPRLSPAFMCSHLCLL